MLTLEKKESRLLVATLLILLSACNVPEPPDAPLCMLDVKRGDSICHTIVTQTGPTFVNINRMDKWSCMSPRSKELYDNYVKDLRRRAERANR